METGSFLGAVPFLYFKVQTTRSCNMESSSNVKMIVLTTTRNNNKLCSAKCLKLILKCLKNTLLIFKVYAVISMPTQDIAQQPLKRRKAKKAFKTMSEKFGIKDFF